VTLLVRKLVRGQAVVVLGIRIGAIFQQQLHHGMIAVLGGGVQGSPALLLAGIDGRAMFQQGARDGQISSGCGGMKRHHPHAIVRDRARVGMVFEQHARDTLLPEERSEVQGRESVTRACIREPRIMAHKVLDQVRAPQAGGFKNVEVAASGAQNVGHIFALAIEGVHQG
jgi:hypothetical protein